MTAALDNALRFENLKRFFAARYASAGIKVTIDPGPDSDTDLENLAVDRMLFILVGTGPGLNYEGMCDRVTVRLRWIGRQGDYDDTENTVLTDDLALLSATDIDGVHVNYVDRQGGRPVLLKRDAGNRYHFTCSYITETASGL